MYTAELFDLFASICSCLQDVERFSQNFPKNPLAHVQWNFCLACSHSSMHVPPLEQGLSSQHLLLHGSFAHALFLS